MDELNESQRLQHVVNILNRISYDLNQHCAGLRVCLDHVRYGADQDERDGYALLELMVNGLCDLNSSLHEEVGILTWPETQKEER